MCFKSMSKGVFGREVLDIPWIYYARYHGVYLCWFRVFGQSLFAALEYNLEISYGRFVSS